MSTKTLLRLITIMLLISGIVTAIMREKSTKALYKQRIELLEEKVMLQDSIIIIQDQLIKQQNHEHTNDNISNSYSSILLNR